MTDIAFQGMHRGAPPPSSREKPQWARMIEDRTKQNKPGSPSSQRHDIMRGSPVNMFN